MRRIAGEHPPTRALAAPVLWVSIACLALYLALFDQGAVSQAGELLHEVMHDGRHVLGVPCH